MTDCGKIPAHRVCQSKPPPAFINLHFLTCSSQKKVFSRPALKKDKHIPYKSWKFFLTRSVQLCNEIALAVVTCRGSSMTTDGNGFFWLNKVRLLCAIRKKIPRLQHVLAMMHFADLGKLQYLSARKFFKLDHSVVYDVAKLQLDLWIIFGQATQVLRL